MTFCGCPYLKPPKDLSIFLCVLVVNLKRYFNITEVLTATMENDYNRLN